MNTSAAIRFSSTRRAAGTATPRMPLSFLGLAALLVAWLCFAGVVNAGAQPMRFDRLSLEDGLSQATVNQIFQDSRGYLWFATEDGLNRYDGQSMTVFKHDRSDPFSIADDYVWALDEDADGNLWIATDGGGVAIYDPAEDSFHRWGSEAGADNGAASDNIRTLRFDSAYRLWIGTRDAGISRVDPATGSVTHFAHDPSDPVSLADDRIFAIHRDSSGRIWIGTDNGLDRYDENSNGFVHYLHDADNAASLGSSRVRTIHEDRDGALWVGTRDAGLSVLDPSTGSFDRFRHDPADAASLSHDRVRSILEDDSGRLWIGSNAGLDLLDRSTGGFAHYGNDPADPTSLSHDDVMSIFQDRGGVLWIGTQSGGVNKWNPLSWQFGHRTALASDPEGLASPTVTSFTEDREGDLWVGTFGGGLHRMDRATGKMTHFRHDANDAKTLSSDRVMALATDVSGDLWIGTLNGGLNRYDAASGKFTIYRPDPDAPDSLAANGIMSLLRDRAGALWIGTFGGGLDRFDPTTGTFTHFKSDEQNPTSLSGNRVTCLAEAPDGRLWVGTDAAGLNLLDPRSGETIRFANDPRDPSSLSANTVYSLYVDNDGSLWVGTRGGGLDHLSSIPAPLAPAVFENYAEKHGLASDAVYGIRPDDDGNLWLSTNNGLSRFDPNNGTFKNYNASHGLQSNEFNFGASFRASDGEFFFGGVNGFNAFRPERLQHNEHVPPVVLTALMKLNRPIESAGPANRLDAIDLGFRDDVVTFEFAALDFTAPERNRYAYMLEGFDRDWIDLGNINRVTYTNLDGGEYVFRVKAANNDGVWNEQGLALPLAVDPPPWKTGWAYVGYILSFVGCVFGFVRIQQRKLEREEEYSGRLEQDVRSRTAKLGEHAAELEALNKKLVEVSITDSLTGLANRRFLLEYLNKEIALVHRRYKQIDTGTMTKAAFDMSFMMIDLDNFKIINDTFGHLAGDEVLKQMRAILEDACRSSDILIRWGGDEFLVLARDADHEGLEILAERIRARIEAHVFELGDGRVVRTTCSLGFACYPFIHARVDALSWEQVVSVADRALYAAKRTGRNAWVGFLSTQNTPPKGLLRLIDKETDRLVRAGLLAVRSSVDKRRLVTE